MYIKVYPIIVYVFVNKTENPVRFQNKTATCYNNNQQIVVAVQCKYTGYTLPKVVLFFDILKCNNQRKHLYRFSDSFITSIFNYHTFNYHLVISTFTIS